MMFLRYVIPVLALTSSSYQLGRLSGRKEQVETYKKVGYTEVMIACLDMTKDDQVLCASITNRVRELKE